MLHLSYRCGYLIVAHVGYVYLPNHLVTLHIWVSNFKCRLYCMAFLSESTGYTTLIGVQL